MAAGPARPLDDDGQPPPADQPEHQSVSRSYIQAALRRADITAQDLRADRLLGEAQASGGDPLRLTHLFGVSDPTAIRYCAEVGPPGQTGPGPR